MHPERDGSLPPAGRLFPPIEIDLNSWKRTHSIRTRTEILRSSYAALTLSVLAAPTIAWILAIRATSPQNQSCEDAVIRSRAAISALSLHAKLPFTGTGRGRNLQEFRGGAVYNGHIRPDQQEFCMRPLKMNRTNKKWFRVPDRDVRDVAYIRISDALKDLDISDYAIEPPATVEMNWDAFQALLAALEIVALPIDRYFRWLSRNDDEGYLNTQIDRFLSRFGFSESRKDIIYDALHAIEPYPSRKPVDRFKIQKVLEEAGRVAPAGCD
jgi:hypothetical protein